MFNSYVKLPEGNSEDNPQRRIAGKSPRNRFMIFPPFQPCLMTPTGALISYQLVQDFFHPQHEITII
jgi:hypothetical protein